MTIIVASQIIEKKDRLSALACQTLAYIDGGPQWLDAAISNPGATYTFADEAAMLAQVQLGLHASPLTLLPTIGLLVGPVKLMTLGSANLHALGVVETGDASDDATQQVQRILDDNGLVTAVQLAGAARLLVELDVGEAPVFHGLDLDGRLALHGLARLTRERPDPLQLRQDAAAYALEQSHTVLEFCDYYQVYLAHVRKVDAVDANAAVREQLVHQAVQTLLPLALGVLDCPQLPNRLPSPDEVETSMHRLLAQGYRIGFPRVSLVVMQMVTQTIFSTETGAEAARLFERYLHTVRGFLTEQRFTQRRLGQDGSTLTFTLADADHEAQVQVSGQRVLSLRSFGARPSDPPASASTNLVSE